MKKLLNQPDDIMMETIKGFVAENQKRLKLNEGTHEIVRRNPKEKGKVKIVVGNGGGHEPGLMGWVGKGMLDMDCLGEIFTAQAGPVFFEGIQNLDDGSPILIAIANHEGDVVNGNMAYAMALDEDMDVQKAVFWDDVASAPKGREDERRGMAGMLFGLKAAGAAAEAGASLDECVRVFEKARDNTRTFAIALTSCTHPVTGLKMFDIPEDVVEMGGGIHGEGGMDTIPFASSKEICRQVCDKLIEDKPFVAGDEVVVEVNGSGSTTMMEMSIFYNDVCEYLAEKGIKVYDGLAGEFITTQELGGLSLTFCKMDDELKELWDAPCSTPAYCNM